MNPYAIVSSGIGSADAASLRARLMAWHDAMVAHERRLRSLVRPASLFPFAVLVVGVPLALSVRRVFEAISWIVNVALQ